jgi:ubiquinone/menaquinone biosynthesis C-methylase UbiE
MNSVSQQDAERPVYPTWIRSRRVVAFWLVTVGIVVLAAVVALFGNDGRLLDVGCGSGQLLIRFAKSAPGEYVGLDHWGDNWEYSQSQAERNAQLEGVQGLQFLHGSASCLPFSDGDFRRVVSSLTFHEVRDVAVKAASIAEALRVLEPGGRFAFVDLFDDPVFYDGRDQVLKTIQRAGGEVRSAGSLSELLELHFPLTMAKVLKYAVIVSGIKTTVIEPRVSL